MNTNIWRDLQIGISVPLKKRWRAITDRAKSGSGLAPDKKPQWCSIQKSRP